MRIVSLLSSDRAEAAVLEPPQLELEGLEVDDRVTAPIAKLSLVDVVAFEVEEGQSAAVQVAHFDAAQLAAAAECVGRQVEVFGLEHGTSLPQGVPPRPAVGSPVERRSAGSATVEPARARSPLLCPGPASGAPARVPALARLRTYPSSLVKRVVPCLEGGGAITAMIPHD
jgi:hypothetical protein